MSKTPLKKAVKSANVKPLTVAPLGHLKPLKRPVL